MSTEYALKWVLAPCTKKGLLCQVEEQCEHRSSGIPPRQLSKNGKTQRFWSQADSDSNHGPAVCYLKSFQQVSHPFCRGLLICGVLISGSYLVEELWLAVLQLVYKIFTMSEPQLVIKSHNKPSPSTVWPV